MSEPKLFAWYRAIPIALLVVLGAACMLFQYAPSALLQAIYPLKYEEQIKTASKRYDVDPYLVAAVIRTESSWNPDATSSQGAQGLMQIMPATAKSMADQGLIDASVYPASSLKDPNVNIEYGCAYLSYLLKRFEGNEDRAIAAYNAGASNVEEWASSGTVLHNAITYPETQAYLVRVNNAHDRYQEIYPSTFS